LALVWAAMSGVKLLDLFSGIGGFHLGFERAGFEFDYVGFAEVDKYASAVYKYNNPFAEELGDVKSIRSENLPKIDIITFGSPCQDFSIAGKRAGATEGTRSSLIWEAIRLIDECKPRVFVWENVKGTFSSNNGADFWAIIQAFTNIGSYRLEWQLLNTRWFLPQNRERLYLVGYTGDRGGRSVFPIGEDGNSFNSKRKTNATYSSTITARYHKMGDMDTYIDESNANLIQTFTERSFDGKRADGGRAIRYHKVPGETPCLSSQMGMGGNNVPMMVQPVIDPRRHNKSQNGRLIQEDGEDMFTLTQQDQHGVKISYHQKHKTQTKRIYNDYGLAPTLPSRGEKTGQNSPIINSNTSIRRLTPVECMRLQGFPDNHNEFGLLNGKKVAISDTQRYKQAGNAVTVDVVAAVARKIKELL
tara:strand:+ start:371 stop:1621 length:1251 start_codon:yes stop_codon:yes gene_type:complete